MYVDNGITLGIIPRKAHTQINTHTHTHTHKLIHSHIHTHSHTNKYTHNAGHTQRLHVHKRLSPHVLPRNEDPQVVPQDTRYRLTLTLDCNTIRGCTAD